MYFVGKYDLETILKQKNMSEDGYIWSLDPTLHKVISLYDFQIPVFIVILTNEFGTSTVQIPSIAILRLEPGKNGISYCQIMMRSLSNC